MNYDLLKTEIILFCDKKSIINLFLLNKYYNKNKYLSRNYYAVKINIKHFKLCLCKNKTMINYYGKYKYYFIQELSNKLLSGTYQYKNNYYLYKNEFQSNIINHLQSRYILKNSILYRFGFNKEKNINKIYKYINHLHKSKNQEITYFDYVKINIIYNIPELYMKLIKNNNYVKALIN